MHSTAVNLQDNYSKVSAPCRILVTIFVQAQHDSPQMAAYGAHTMRVADRLAANAHVQLRPNALVKMLDDDLPPAPVNMCALFDSRVSFTFVPDRQTYWDWVRIEQCCRFANVSTKAPRVKFKTMSRTSRKSSVTSPPGVLPAFITSPHKDESIADEVLLRVCPTHADWNDCRHSK